MGSPRFGEILTDSNYTHIKMVVDRSGSMGTRVGGVATPYNHFNTQVFASLDYETVASKMTKAINEFFTEQARVEGTCLVDYAQFDTQYELLYEDRPVVGASAVIQPRGMTALNDAIGRAITELGVKLSALPESRRPGKVILVIVTDGFENSSTEYTRSRVKEMIGEQTGRYNWDVVFLGANMDAVAEAATFGIKAGSSLTYDTNYSGATVSSLSNYTTAVRSGSKASFSEEDRRNAVGKK